MLSMHNYSTKAFLPSDGELLYCALFETNTAHVNLPVVRIVEVFWAAEMWACTPSQYFLKE